eukprot:1156962-Pelagomonas_calceolata.AAC.4
MNQKLYIKSIWADTDIDNVLSNSDNICSTVWTFEMGQQPSIDNAITKPFDQKRFAHLGE